MQNPLPEYPDQLASIVPAHTEGEPSASCRVGAACAAEDATTTSAPANRPTQENKDLERMMSLRGGAASGDGEIE
ncbi:hypothetical protein GCM10027184_07860 [Saccharothrix stipae]